MSKTKSSPVSRRIDINQRTMDSYLQPVSDVLWHARGKTYNQAIVIVDEEEDPNIEDHEFTLYVSARLKQIETHAERMQGLPAWSRQKLGLMEHLFQQCMNTINQ